MAERMHIYKSTRFSHNDPVPVPISGLDPDWRNYPDITGNANSYRLKMRSIASTSQHASGLGGWFAARCIETPNNDDTGQIDNLYAVYFALNAAGSPIIASNIGAAAPCPPFCTDDNLG